MDPISSLSDTRELSQLKVQPKCMTSPADFVEPKVLYHQHQTSTVDSSSTSSSVLENLHSWNHESLQYETERVSLSVMLYLNRAYDFSDHK